MIAIPGCAVRPHPACRRTAVQNLPWMKGRCVLISVLPELCLGTFAACEAGDCYATLAHLGLDRTG